ncbi:MAG TPA: FmdE family protein [Methanothermobacter sp.]|nr:conserved hypothetical protein [Methanothermobacter sp. MT-2]HHW04766.1 hypothetical protein [Methanothermobacter sp.]HOL68977.1 FmdE family protein [Methanothermobacter sp.]
MQYNSGPDANSGKENLLFKDHGKHVYSLIDRRTRKSIRTCLNKSIKRINGQIQKTRGKNYPKKILEMDPYEFFTVRKVKMKPQKKQGSTIH